MDQNATERFEMDWNLIREIIDEPRVPARKTVRYPYLGRSGKLEQVILFTTPIPVMTKV